MKKNPTLTENMPNVKWKELPPIKGPDSQGIKTTIPEPKRFKTILTVSKKKFNLLYLYLLATQVGLLLCLLLYLL